MSHKTDKFEKKLTKSHQFHLIILRSWHREIHFSFKYLHWDAKLIRFSSLFVNVSDRSTQKPAQFPAKFMFPSSDWDRIVEIPDHFTCEKLTWVASILRKKLEISWGISKDLLRLFSNPRLILVNQIFDLWSYPTKVPDFRCMIDSFQM